LSQTLAGWSVQALADTAARMEALRAHVLHAPGAARIARRYACLLMTAARRLVHVRGDPAARRNGVEWLY
jgi:hypothetical protein